MREIECKIMTMSSDSIKSESIEFSGSLTVMDLKLIEILQLRLKLYQEKVLESIFVNLIL